VLNIIKLLFHTMFWTVQKKVLGKEIRVCFIGAGNCWCSVMQGIYYYKNLKDDGMRVSGIMHNVICGYLISSINVRLVIDIDVRKVGKKIKEAMFAKPNCTKIFCRKEDIPDSDVVVKMGYVSDGVAPHMLEYPNKDKTFVIANEEPVNFKEELIKEKIDVVVCFLPTGSQKAVKEKYVPDIIAAGCGFVNGIPVFVASDEKMAEKFRKAGLPVIGDDVKSLLGSTVLQRVVAWLFNLRGLKIIDSCQLNYGGNTDFLNLAMVVRKIFKIISKKSSILCFFKKDELKEENLVIDAQYVPYLNDNKRAVIEFNATQFGDVPTTLHMDLSVEDSPNSAGIIIDAIRLCKVAMDRGLCGPIIPACAHLMKHPPVQMEEGEAREELERFIADSSRNVIIGHNLTKDNAQSGDVWSEYWQEELAAAQDKARELKRHCEILTTDRYDNDQTVDRVEEGVSYLSEFPDGYEKNIYLPLSAGERKHKERIIKALASHPEINVWAINSESDEDYLEGIPNIRGYIGVDNFRLGQMLCEELLAHSSVLKVIVFKHQENSSLDLRIKGVRDYAERSGKEVVVCTNDQELKEVVSFGDIGGIALGIRGAEKFIKLSSSFVFTSVDTSPRIAKVMADKNTDKKILAVFTQKGMGENIFNGRTTIINPVRVTA